MEYVIRGTVGSLELKDCTVVNYGLIKSLHGEICEIVNNGTVINDNAARKESDELRMAKKRADFWQDRAYMLNKEVRELRADLEDAERQKLLRTIDDLKAKLNAARSRENVLVRQRDDAMREARTATQRIWDDLRPTKEACRRLFNNLKAYLDCED